MEIIVLFGLPGVGKSYIGKFIEKEYGWYFYDGDLALPVDMKQALFQKQEITQDMRNRFSQQMIDAVKDLQKKYKKIVLAQTFLKSSSRELFLKTFPYAKFLLVTATTAIRQKRYHTRKEWFLGSEYEKKMSSLFDEPTTTAIILENSLDGELGVKKQLQKYFTLNN